MKTHSSTLRQLVLRVSISALAVNQLAQAQQTDAISREFTVHNDLSSNTLGSDASTREFTVHNNLSTPTLGSDAIAREFTLINLFADCNGNMIADRQDIDDCDPGNLECADCQPNNIPDGCEPDCDGDMIPDSCEIAACNGEPGCSDCNGNGVPDECELPDACPDGSCTSGCDADCNANCILDACDIADCTPGDPTCEDCNLNGLPDSCDDPVELASVCVEFTGNCPDDSDDWSCAANWDNDIVPDNTVDDTYSVTLRGSDTDAVLDITVEIDTLRSIEGATLTLPSAGGGDLSLAQSGGLLVRGDALEQSLITQDSDRSLAVAGVATIQENGAYAFQTTDGSGGGSMTAEALVVEGATSPAVPGGQLVLGEGSDVLVANDISLTTVASGKGSGTPPDFITIGDADVATGRDFVIGGIAQVQYASANALVIDGSFVNGGSGSFLGQPYATLYDWYTDGGSGVEFTRQVDDLGDTAVHEIEAASLDVGPLSGGLANNFAFGLLRLAPESAVRVVNHFDNQNDGVAPCDEAIYVNTLEIGAGAVLITEGCKVYYNQLIGESDGNIIELADDLEQLPPAGDGDINGDGVVDAADLALVLDDLGPCDGCPTDLDNNGVVDSLDIDILLNQWG